MKCYENRCYAKPIVRFEYNVHKECYCLDHLVERLEYIRDNKLFNLLTETKKIIPIFNF